MANEKVWHDVDQYLNGKLVGAHDVFEEVLKENEKEGLPAIDVSPTQGKFLHLLAKIKGAKRILEIGTLGGYSTIWLARALPSDGKLVTLEVNKKHAEVAQGNVKRAHIDHLVEIIVGSALETLPLLKEKGESFDLIFIDADKPNNPHYLKGALQLSKKGTVIIGDNVVREGRVIEEDSEDESVKGIREFINLLSGEKQVDATALQTVGSKGYDGLVFGIVG
ncbi:methyltransferase [Priestia filamentosa]|uniref:Methyltransferase n=1 Tax=Priestia filamentosa TaxID=1402861 RepID=A0A0H4KIC2_9BACI|nr:O-methyltransferase [Priestia filamentosa]AKO92561.1 methyltransferase [Priestia filamentosa]